MEEKQFLHEIETRHYNDPQLMENAGFWHSEENRKEFQAIGIDLVKFGLSYDDALKILNRCDKVFDEEISIMSK